MTKLRFPLLFLMAILASPFVALSSSSFAASPTNLANLKKSTHFHGIGVVPGTSGKIYLATHHGLYTVAPDGRAVRISPTTNDFMGFTPHPVIPGKLYASGHPVGGGNMGFISSSNGGMTWQKLSDGVNGPVDFHQMDISKADPNFIIGNHRGLQLSQNGGRNWSKIGPAPKGIIDLAASAKHTNTLYAGTRGGLLKSSNLGATWQRIHPEPRPATMVHVSRDGEIYSFIFGLGLVRSQEKSLKWTLLSKGFGNSYMLHFAIAPANRNNLYAIAVDAKTKKALIISSQDGGKSWGQFGL